LVSYPLYNTTFQPIAKAVDNWGYSNGQLKPQKDIQKGKNDIQIDIQLSTKMSTLKGKGLKISTGSV
jgi:hypothetical protein